MSFHDRPSVARAPQVVAFLLVVGMCLQLAIGLRWRWATFAAFVANVALWLTFARAALASRLSPTWLWSTFAALVVLAVSFSPATSKDVNSYALYGHMLSEHGLSPYRHTALDVVADPWFPRTSYFWSDAPSVYGPLFTGLSAAVMATVGDSVRAARLGFQLLAAAALIGCVLLLRRRQGTAVAMVLGCNPVAVALVVNDGHCDALVGLGLLAAALALERGKVVVAGGAVAGAVLVKVIAAPALLGGALWLLARRGWRQGARAAAGFLVAATVTVVAVSASLGGTDATGPLLHAASRLTRFSIWEPVAWLLGALGATGAEVTTTRLAVVVVALAGTVAMWRYRTDPGPAMALAAGPVAYQLLGGYVLSWYVIWALPLLVMRWRERWCAIALAHATWVAGAYFSGYGALALAAVLAAWTVVAVRSRRPWNPLCRNGTSNILARS